MKQTNNMNRTKTEIAYPLVFVAIAALYFREGIFGGALLAATGDAIQYFYPTYELAWKMLHAGELPLWNPYMFGGMPLMGAHQHALLYPPTLLIIWLFEPRAGFNMDFALHYAAAGYFAFLYLRRVSGSWSVALALAVSAELMGLLHLNPDHISILRAGVWLPLSLWLMARLFDRASLVRAIHLGLCLAMLPLAGHAQMAFYSTMLLIGYFGYMLLMSEPASRPRTLAWAALSAALAFAIASPQLIATAELATLSSRTSLSFEEFTSGSIDPAMLGGLLYPALYANPYRFAIGAFVLMMALAAGVRLVMRRDKLAVFWTLVGLVAAALALGEHLPGYALMSRVPGYNLFRCPERLWYIVQLAALTLCALGLRDILREPRIEGRWYLRWLAAGTCVMALVPLAGSALFRPEHGAVDVAYASGAVILPLVLAMASLGALYLIVAREGRARTAALLALAALFAVEGFSIRPDIDGWNEYADAVALERPKGYLSQVAALVQDSRVGFYQSSYKEMGVSIAAPLMHEVRMLGGYDPLAPRKYIETLGYETTTSLGSESVIRLLQEGGMLRGLAVRALVLCKLNADEIKSAHGYQYETYMRTHGGKCALYKNNAALPRAYIVHKGNAMKKDAEIFFDPWAAVAAGASIESERAMNVRIRVDSPEDGAYLVLADQFYPGWEASIDGAPVDIIKANAILRAVRLTPGAHAVSFTYWPPAIHAALMLMVVAYLAAGALLLFVSIRGRAATHKASA